MSFFLMFALQCLFPILDTTTADYTGLSLVNPENQSREFTVTTTSPDGTNVQTGRLTIAAGNQRALLFNEILGTAPAPSSGWLRVDSATSCLAYMTSGNEEVLAGAEAASSTSTNIILPHITVNTGFADTLLAIVNAGTASANVTIQFFGLDGVAGGTSMVVVPARGSRTLRVSDTFRDASPTGYVRLFSDVPVAAWQRIETSLSRSLFRGKTQEEIRATSTAMLPHFVINGGYVSVLNIVNPTATSLSLEVSAVDDRGSRVGEIVQLTLAAGEARRDLVERFFRVVQIAIFPPPVITGYVRIRQTQGQLFQVAGDIEIYTNDAVAGIGSAMVYPIGDIAANSWTIPFAVSSSQYFTGYAVATPNELLAVQTDVQVEVVNSDGTVVNRSTISLSPRNRQAALIPGAIQTGYIRFTSNLPIHVMGAIGSRNLRVLEQLPALR